MANPIAEAFEFCPRCGHAAATTGVNPFHCTACDYTHFFGPCTAVAGVIRDSDGKVLFLKRQRDPAKDKLGLPGGFVDPGEPAETALRREAMEEVNLTIERLTFLASFPNTYEFSGVRLPVTDLFFTCDVESFDVIKADPAEIAGFHFAHPDEATLDQMAFESNRKAVELAMQQ